MSSWRETDLPRIGYPRPVMAEQETTPVTDLAYMRRERADANIRSSIRDLRALAVEHPDFATHYRATASVLDSAVRVLGLIEDALYTRKVRVTL